MQLVTVFPWCLSIVSTKFHIDRERRFLYEFSVEKLVFLSSPGYIGEIESEKKKLGFFHIIHICMCRVVSGSVHPKFKS